MLVKFYISTYLLYTSIPFTSLVIYYLLVSATQKSYLKLEAFIPLKRLYFTVTLATTKIYFNIVEY